MFADYDISLGQAEDIPGILVLQEMNLAERGGGLSVRQTGDWFRHAMHVVGRQKNKVVGYVLGTSLAANTHVTIIQTMLRAFPPPPDCYLYSTTLCKARWRHGNADTTVIPSNARETIKQWTDVHGLSNAPSNQVTIEGYPRQVWLNGAGEEIVESYTITHMAHGTPLATGDADFECGAAGPFLLEVGISSSFHIAKFFGLTLNSARP
jgi:hypothetical protein